MSDSEDKKKTQNDLNNEKLSQFFDDVPRQTVIYQYLCSSCNSITEEQFPFGEPEPNVPCRTPGCGGVAMKIISTPNVLIGIPVHEARKGRGQG